jgi:hypothetical protein
LPMKMVPMGTQVFNVGSTTNKGAVFCRSAGTHATVIAKNDVAGIIRDVTVRLQSGEVRRVSAEACATIGVASNPHWQFRQLGKAGRSRHLNIRPTVRGLAMNAADHAHGGGRGKSKGNVHPVSIWGTPVSFDVFFLSRKFMLLTNFQTGQRWFQDPPKAQPQQARCPGESAQPGQAQEHQLSSSKANSAFCCTSPALCTLRMHQTMYIIEIYLDVQLQSPAALLGSSHAMFSLSYSLPCFVWKRICKSTHTSHAHAQEVSACADRVESTNRIVIS